MDEDLKANLISPVPVSRTAMPPPRVFTRMIPNAVLEGSEFHDNEGIGRLGVKV